MIFTFEFLCDFMCSVIEPFPQEDKKFTATSMRVINSRYISFSIANKYSQMTGSAVFI